MNPEDETLSDQRKVFQSIVPECSKCGHRAPLYISNENVAKQLQEYTRSRFAALWRPLMVWRIAMLVGAALTLGAAFGRWCR